MKNVVLIGSGKRAQTVILPALWCVRDEYSISGILSRSEKELNLFNGRFRMKTQTSYDSVDWSLIDIVIIAVTLDAVPLVVLELAQRDTRHAILMMDTPVLPLRRLGTMKVLKHFKRVQVSEDTLGLPPFVAARNIIDEGLIGKVKHIWLFHSGYRYHALASLKWLTRSTHIRYARMKRWSRSSGVKEIKLSSGATATVVEPRDYSIGRFLIVGEKGSVGDYPTERAEHHYVVESGDMTQMKIHGFMEMLSNIDNPQSPYRYSPIDGVYDAFVIACLEKTGYFVDVNVFGRSLVKYLINMFTK